MTCLETEDQGTDSSQCKDAELEACFSLTLSRQATRECFPVSAASLRCLKQCLDRSPSTLARFVKRLSGQVQHKSLGYVA